MSAPNFNSNQLGFPLYVHEDVYSKVCPECGAWNNAEEETCYECGENLENEESRYDAYDTEYLSDEVWNDLKKLNEELDFFAVGLSSGYYSGLQFDVDWKNIRGWGVYGDPEELDNEDAHYYFDCCRSEMLRRYQRERRKLGKKLKELADYHGFEEIVCVGRFSNGEAVYERVERSVKKYGYKAKVNAPVGVNA